MKRVNEVFLVTLWLSFLAIITTARIILTGEYTYLSLQDQALQSYPWYTYAAHSISQGEIPLWNFNQLSGYSFVGSTIPGVFYPLNLLLFFILSKVPTENYHELAPQVIEQMMVARLIVCALFSYWMFRELRLSKSAAIVGATVFAYSGFPFLRLAGQFCVFDSLMWIPFIFAAYIKALSHSYLLKKLLWLQTAGIGLGMSFLAGHYMGFVYGFLVVSGYSLYLFCRENLNIINQDNFFKLIFSRKFLLTGLCLTIFVLVGLLLSGVQLFPTVEYSKLALRWVSGPNPVSSGEKIPYFVLGDQFRFTPASLLSLLNPKFEQFNMNLGIDGILYSSIVASILSILAIWKQRQKDDNVNFFIMILVISMLYLLGGESLLHATYNILLPISDPVRAASRATLLTHFAIASLAAYGTQYFVSFDSSNTTTVTRFLTRIILALIAAIFTLPILVMFFSEGKHDALNSLTMTIWLSIASCGLLLFWIKQSPRWNYKRNIILAVFLTLLITQDTYYFNISGGRFPRRQYAPPGWIYPPKVIQTHAPSLENLEGVKTVYRVWNFSAEELRNIGDVLGIKVTYGYGASMAKKYFTFLSTLGFDNQKLHDLLAAKYIVEEKEPSSTEPVKIRENSSALPIFRFYNNYKVISEQLESIQALNDSNFDYKNTIILNQEPDWSQFDHSKNGNVSPNDQASITRQTVNQVELLVESTKPQVLVFADLDYPGWYATVDNQKVELMTGDGIFKAISIPSGESKVIFKYQPLSVRLGGLTLIIVFIIYIANIALVILNIKNIREFKFYN